MKKIFAGLIAGFLFASPAFADSTIDALSAGATLTGTESIPMFQTANPAVRTSPNAIKTFVGLNGLIPYNTTNFYIPWNLGTTTTVAAIPAATIRCFMAYIKGQATMDTLGVRVTTANASSNLQFAIYAVSTTTGLPSGTALVTTASISGAATGNVNNAVNSGVPFQLGSSTAAFTPYAFCTNVDANGATVQMPIFSGGSTNQGGDFGASTANNLFNGANGPVTSISVAQTFGTWPNLTGAGWTFNAFGSPIPVMHFSSVP